MRDDDLLIALLAPLARIEAPALAPRRRRRLRPLFVVALVLGAVLLAGTALASGVAKFPGIASANHPAKPSDALTPGALELLRLDVPPGGAFGPAGRMQPHSARSVGTFAGRKVYVLATTSGKLCVMLAGRSSNSSDSCGDQLTLACPITFTAEKRAPDTPPLAYGVARDDVASVSFVASGRPVTVPVHDNFWGFVGAPLARPDFQHIRVTLVDGASFVPCPG